MCTAAGTSKASPDKAAYCGLFEVKDCVVQWYSCCTVLHCTTYAKAAGNTLKPHLLITVRQTSLVADIP